MELPPKEQDATLSPLSSPNINIELEQVQQQQELAQFEGAGTGGVAEGSSPLEVEITTPTSLSLNSIGNPPLECSYKRGFCNVHLRKGFKNIRKSKKWGKTKKGFGWIYRQAIEYYCKMEDCTSKVPTNSSQVEVLCQLTKMGESD